MAAKNPEPLIIPFWTRGLFVNRQPFFNPLTPVGVSVVHFQDSLIDGVNVEVSDRLTLQRAPGFSKYCSQQLASGETVNQFYSVRDLADNVYPLVDTNLALYSATTTALTPILTKTTPLQSFVQQVGDITYITDSVDLVKWYRGSTTPWGIAAPTAAPSLYNTLNRSGSWIAGLIYPVGSTLLDANGNIEYATTGGYSGISLPVWSPTVGATTNDGTVVWEQCGTLGQWIAGTPYTAPTVITDTNSNIQLVTVAGTSGNTAPVWSTTLGGTTSDNGITWTNISSANVIAYSGFSYVNCYRTLTGNCSTASPVSQNTGPLLRSTNLSPIAITSYSVTSNVVTFQATNTLSSGALVTLQGFTNSTFFNGQTVAVLSSGLTTSSFNADFTTANTTSVLETGNALPVIATLSGLRSTNPECNSVANITKVDITSNTATITCANNFVPGLAIRIDGLLNATFLNGQIIFVESTNVTPITQATQFTATFTHPDFPGVPDTGTATFLAVEVYRTADGGGVPYFDSAVENPTATTATPFTTGEQLAGTGTNVTVPGGVAWSNPGNVTSPSSYASVSMVPMGTSTTYTTTLVQVATASTGIGTNAYSFSVTLPNPITAGNTVIAAFGQFDFPGGWMPYVSDSLGNTYTWAGGPGVNGSYSNGFYWSNIVNAGACTITFSGLGFSLASADDQAINLIASEWTNLGSQDSFASVTNVFYNGSIYPPAANYPATATSGTITTGVPNTLIFSGVQQNGVTPTSPFTYLASTNTSGRFNIGESISYYQASSINTYTPTWNIDVPCGSTLAMRINGSTPPAPSDILQAQGFPISVPVTTAITGITITFDAYYNGAVGDGIIFAQLLKNGAPVGSTFSIAPTNSSATYTLGGTTNLWGESWVYSDFNINTWGVQFTTELLPQSGTPYVFYIRNVNATVTGSTGANEWVFYDVAPDADLDNETIAPLNHLNDPPPGAAGSLETQGGTIITHWNNRIWMAVGNYLYFSGGPDVINGNPDECFPPGNVWTFPQKIESLSPSTGGLIVKTASEWWAILGGPQTIAFYPQRIFGNFGVLSPNTVAQDGDQIYAYTSQKQIFQINPSKTEIGYPITPILAKGQSTPSATVSIFPATSSYLTMHREGQDSAIYISNGVDTIMRFSLNQNNWSTVRQPYVTGVPSAGPIASVETTPGNYTLLMASPTPQGYIYKRDLTVWEDDGHAYPANVVIGNITAAEIGEPMLPLHFIGAYFANVGSVPTMSFMPNEIAVGGAAQFTVLPIAQSEPAFLAPSASLMAKRWPVNMNQAGTPLLIKHLQVNVNFGTDTVQNELMILGLRYDKEQMV